MTGFILTVVGSSLSGVMAPGPITAATLAAGERNRHAGTWICIGHIAVELPLILQISDKGQIIARNEGIRCLTRMQSRRQVEQAIKMLESLRNNLAHSQDIISCDWETIVWLCKDMERVISGTDEVKRVLEEQ